MKRLRKEYHRRWWRARNGVPLDQPVRGTEDFLMDPKSVYRHKPPVRKQK